MIQDHKTSCEISYELVDVTAAQDAALSAPDQQPWSKISDLHDGARKIKNWATMEPNLWLLDGEREILPEHTGGELMGIWSQSMSGPDCAFAQPPTLDITFTSPHTSIGLTLTFSEATGDWASQVRIQWYGKHGETLADQEFSPQGGMYFCACLVEGYYRVRVTFLKTNWPHRFLKLTGIRYGALQTFDGESLTAAKVVEEVSLLSEEVRINMLYFTFHSASGEFDLLDPSGAYVAFQQRQQVRVREYLDGQVLEMGIYYLQEPQTDGNITEMTCTDLVGLLDGTDFLGGLWLGGISFGQLVGEIMTSAGLGQLYEVDPALAAVRLTGYLPICTHREALQQAAFAVGAVVSCARRDKVRLFPKPSAVSHTISTADKAVGHTLRQRELVTGVEVYAPRYQILNTISETELFRQSCQPGERMVTFGSLADVASMTCTGAVILEKGVNFARIKVTAAGVVTLTSYVYEESRSLAGSMYAAALPANAAANVLKVEDCTLTADPQAMARRIYEERQGRIVEEGTLLPGLWEPGDLVEIRQATGKTLRGYLTALEIDLTGGMIARAEATGSPVT